MIRSGKNARATPWPNRPLLVFLSIVLSVLAGLLVVPIPGHSGALISTGPPVKAYQLMDIAVQGYTKNITLLLYPKAAPNTVANLVNIANTRGFANCGWYRAEPGFCLQGGCHAVREHPRVPLEYKIPNFERMVSMARGAATDTASSEISVMLRDNSQWNGPGGSTPDGYAVFGRVISGWDLVSSLSHEHTEPNGGLNILNPRFIWTSVTARLGPLSAAQEADAKPYIQFAELG